MPKSDVDLGCGPGKPPPEEKIIGLVVVLPAPLLKEGLLATVVVPAGLPCSGLGGTMP